MLIAHDNVAHIYEVGEQENYCFIAMEYVDGVTLRRHLSDQFIGKTPHQTPAGRYQTAQELAVELQNIRQRLEPGAREGTDASTFLCAKLIYKTLSYIFADETARVRGDRLNVSTPDGV